MFYIILNLRLGAGLDEFSFSAFIFGDDLCFGYICETVSRYNHLLARLLSVHCCLWCALCIQGR